MDYVDANVIIYAFSGEGVKSEAAELLLGGELVTSSLSLDEVGWKFFKVSPKTSGEVLRLLVRSPLLSFKPFSDDLFDDYIALVEGGLPPRDAIHAATALKNGCKVIWSEDKHFDKVKGLKRKVPWK
ncbi:MAG: PIN domain-containing protein [Candidatus Micrarchaeota archaeon]|mgnify:CR=1 FL=1